jgi:hypothetical protein
MARKELLPFNKPYIESRATGYGWRVTVKTSEEGVDHWSRRAESVEELKRVLVLAAYFRRQYENTLRKMHGLPEVLEP